YAIAPSIFPITMALLPRIPRSADLPEIAPLARGCAVVGDHEHDAERLPVIGDRMEQVASRRQDMRELPALAAAQRSEIGDRQAVVARKPKPERRSAAVLDRELGAREISRRAGDGDGTASRIGVAGDSGSRVGMTRDEQPEGDGREAEADDLHVGLHATARMTTA